MGRVSLPGLVFVPRAGRLSFDVFREAVSVKTVLLTTESGATTGRGSHTFGFGGGDAAAAVESPAVATARGDSPHPMAAPMIASTKPTAGGDSMRPAW
jgi:hypothetical protein